MDCGLIVQNTVFFVELRCTTVSNLNISSCTVGVVGRVLSVKSVNNNHASIFKFVIEMNLVQLFSFFPLLICISLITNVYRFSYLYFHSNIGFKFLHYSCLLICPTWPRHHHSNVTVIYLTTDNNYLFCSLLLLAFLSPGKLSSSFEIYERTWILITSLYTYSISPWNLFNFVDDIDTFLLHTIDYHTTVSFKLHSLSIICFLTLFLSRHHSNSWRNFSLRTTYPWILHLLFEFVYCAISIF